jgi:phosphohistidine phosphatase
MELILWRHAEAEVGDPDQSDEDRILTAKGHKQAWRVAEWLDDVLPEGCRILSSPAARTMQTAEALGRKFKIEPRLRPEASVDDILEAADWPDSLRPVLIVGHQPTLGQLAARLLGGVTQDWRIRKAGVWWISQRTAGTDAHDEAASAWLRVVMTPEFAPKPRDR